MESLYPWILHNEEKGEVSTLNKGNGLSLAVPENTGAKRRYRREYY